MTWLIGVGAWVGAALILGFAWALLCEFNLMRRRRR